MKKLCIIFTLLSALVANSQSNFAIFRDGSECYIYSDENKLNIIASEEILELELMDTYGNILYHGFMHSSLITLPGNYNSHEYLLTILSQHKKRKIKIKC